MSNPEKPLDVSGGNHYLSKPISEYTLQELELIWFDLRAAQIKREEASKHEKFDKANNKKAIILPPPNPNFLNLKSAIEEEIRKKEENAAK